MAKKKDRPQDGSGDNKKGGGDRDKSNSANLMSVFNPVRIFLIIVGLAPFTSKHEPDGSFVLKFGINLATILFFILYAISSFGLVGITGGFLLFLMNFFPGNETIPFYEDDLENPGFYIKYHKPWAKHLMKRNLVLFIIIWGCLLISWATATINFKNRSGYLQYVNFWCRAVDKMQMNVAPGATGYFLADHLITILLNGMVFVGFFAPIIHRNIDLIPDLADLITTVMFAPIRNLGIQLGVELSFTVPSQQVLDKDSSHASYYMYKAPGLYLCAYSMCAVRGSILQFVFFNRLLVKACKIWNERLRNALALNTTVEKEAERDQKEKEKLDTNAHVRLDLRNVLRDHLRIVNLFKMTDVIFAWTLLTYYAFQIMATTLVAYALFSLRYEATVYDPRILNYLENDRDKAAEISRSKLDSEREYYEWVTAVQRGVALISIGTLLAMIVILTTKTSARAYEEGMGGFQILRRNFYLGNCDTKDERNFVHDLIVSFAPNNPLIVTAEGYFKIRRSLLPSLMGSVAGYFVACYTLKPDIGDFWG